MLLVWMSPPSHRQDEVSGDLLARRLRERLQPEMTVVGRDGVERNDGRSVRGPLHLSCSPEDIIEYGRIDLVYWYV